jgi:MYXO-CTERM domain-containing protein
MVGNRSRVATAFAAALLFFASTAAMAQESVIGNDSVGETFNGTTASAQLVLGEGYEAVFDIPPEWIGQFGLEILGVRVAMFEGANPTDTYCARFHIDVFEEPMGGSTSTGCPSGAIIMPAPNKKDPGTPIYSMSTDPAVSNIGFEVEGQSRMGQGSFIDLRYSQINNNPNLNVTLNPVVTMVPRVRVRVTPLDFACQQPGSAVPVMLSDPDGVSAALQNFIFGYYEDINSSTFAQFRCGDYSFVWEEFGKTLAFQNSNPGDWVMRLIVAYDDGSTGTIDMGTGGNMDAGAADMSMATDMGTEEDFGMSGMDSGTVEPDSGQPMTDAGGNNNTGNNNTGNNGTGDGLMITSVSPSSGPEDASTNIVIVGEGFELGAEVLLGAENIGVTEVEMGRIRATVPEGFTPGAYDVIVTNPGGATAVLVGGFEVLAATNGSASGAEDGGCGCASGGGDAPGALLLLAIVVGVARIRRRGQA